MMDEVNISVLEGDFILLVEVSDDKDTVKIVTLSGVYLMSHTQDCCESVYVEDIIGDIEDLYGAPVTSAREETSDEAPTDIRSKDVDYYADSETWTFYKIDTPKGGITIRWCGSSNGYYSERVDFHRIK